jgi:hypothetical protein
LFVDCHVESLCTSRSKNDEEEEEEDVEMIGVVEMMAGEVDVVAAITGVDVVGGRNNGDTDEASESLSSRTRFEPTRAREDAD